MKTHACTQPNVAAVGATLRIGVVSLFLIGLGVLGQSPDEVIKRAVVIESLAKYRANFEMLLPVGTDKAKTHGVIYGESPEGGTPRQRRDIETTVRGAPTLRFSLLVIGDKAYQFIPGQNSVIQLPSASLALDPSLTVPVLTDSNNYSLSMREAEREGRKCFVVSASFLEPALKWQRMAAEAIHAASVPLITKQERWVDAESHILCRVASYGEGGRLITDLAYSNVQTNVDLDASLLDTPGSASVIATTNNEQLIKAVVKQTIASIGGPSGSLVHKGVPRKTNILLMLILIQAGAAVLVWGIYKMKRAKSTA
jgi:hypothetical protein